MTPHLAPSTEAGALVFLSGQLAFGADGKIAADDIAGQTRQVLENVAKVLGDVSLKMTDVVKTTVWLKNANLFPGFDASYASFFGSHRPARSTVVCDLVVAQALVEIEVIAVRSRQQLRQDEMNSAVMVEQ